MMGVFRTGGSDQNRICGLPAQLAVIIAMSIGWLAFLLLFIIGILLVVGTLGNAHPKVLEVMNCGNPGSSVSCARVYGYRAEGVVVIMLSFFALAWSLIFAVVFLVVRYRALKQPLPVGGITLRPMHTHTAHYISSKA